MYEFRQPAYRTRKNNTSTILQAQKLGRQLLEPGKKYNGCDKRLPKQHVRLQIQKVSTYAASVRDHSFRF